MPSKCTNTLHKIKQIKLVQMVVLIMTRYKGADNTYRLSVRSEGSVEVIREVTEYIPCILASRTLQKETITFSQSLNFGRVH